jgi:hypothetical protein
MKHRGHRGSRHGHDDLNRGDYRGDFGPEGRDRFASPPDHRHDEHHEEHHGRHRHPHDREPMVDPESYRGGRSAGDWERFGREGWQRGRVSGGYGSQYDAWRSGVGGPPAGFGFGPEEDPRRGRFEDSDWQVTRPARGRGAWAGDWAEQSYRGRGPKDYRRSDERIREEVCERLTDDWLVDASDIVVHVKDAEVTLSGNVPSRDQKRRAEECVERVHGVHDVLNELRVVSGGDVERQQSREGRR